MLLNKKITVKNLDHDREVIDRLVDENLGWKLDSYLLRFKEGEECQLSVNITGTKKDHFEWVVQLQVPGGLYRSERDDYKKLEDLVNHLFDHIKEQMSKDKKRFEA